MGRNKLVSNHQCYPSHLPQHALYYNLSYVKQYTPSSLLASQSRSPWLGVFGLSLSSDFTWLWSAIAKTRKVAAALRSVVPEEIEGAVWKKAAQWKEEIRGGDWFLLFFFLVIKVFFGRTARKKTLVS